MKLAAGSHVAAIVVQPLTPADQKVNKLELQLNSLTIRGPADEKFWPNPPKYGKFFTKTEPPKSSSERRKYARELLTAFAAKAFRRPVDSKTADRLTALAENIYSEPGKTFEAGIAHALTGVLASPRFLFRVEENVKASTAPGWSVVDEYSLASRLSYFLWSTMPDEELFTLAGKGELRKNLPAQVKRMLDDSKSTALVQNFTGQWLQARDVDGLAINANIIFAREAPPPRSHRPRRQRSWPRRQRSGRNRIWTTSTAARTATVLMCCWMRP